MGLKTSTLGGFFRFRSKAKFFSSRIPFFFIVCGTAIFKRIGGNHSKPNLFQYVAKPESGITDLLGNFHLIPFERAEVFPYALADNDFAAIAFPLVLIYDMYVETLDMKIKTCA
ncbi:MAG: hypothetical protein GY765_16765 [bacterium]|nr:hypothetical protein [bacterium]